MWGLTCSRTPSFKHGTFEAKEDKARQRKAKQDQARQSKAKQGKVGQSKAQQGRAKPRKAKKQLFGIQCIHFQKLVFECCVLGFCLELVLKLNSQARTQQPTTVRDSRPLCAENQQAHARKNKQQAQPELNLKTSSNQNPRTQQPTTVLDSRQPRKQEHSNRLRCVTPALCARRVRGSAVQRAR
jgi:hypothetical protein